MKEQWTNHVGSTHCGSAYFGVVYNLVKKSSINYANNNQWLLFFNYVLLILNVFVNISRLIDYGS